jgi:hypothetical protein
MSFDDLLNATLVVKRLAAVTAGGAETVGGANTTLTADTAVGATSIAVALGTGITAANFLRIGDTGETEVVVVAGIVGLTVALTTPLAIAHDSGDQVRELDDAGAPVLDGMHQPTFAAATFATVDGRIEPLTAQEVAIQSQGGAVVSTHRGYIWPLTGLTTHDWIECAGVRYDITGMPDAAGHGHHLELQLRAVT